MCIQFTSVLLAGTTYAIELSYPSGDGSHVIAWSDKTSYATYSGGFAWESANSGSTWTFFSNDLPPSASAMAFYFAEYGDKYIEASALSPTSPVGSFINLFPLIFIAMAVLMVIWMGIKNEWGMVGTIIVMAIVIYIAIALLTGMHAMNVNILGV